ILPQQLRTSPLFVENIALDVRAGNTLWYAVPGFWDSTAMECDLDEVSGQMALPLPTHTSARSPEPNFRFPGAHAPSERVSCDCFRGSPHDSQRRLSMVRHWARMAHLRGADHGARHGS